MVMDIRRNSNSSSNFNEICRLCLMTDPNLEPIFAQPIQARLGSFLSVEMFEGDGLPGLICQQCCQEVDRIYKFKQLCEKSDITLKQCKRNISLKPDTTGVLDSEVLHNKQDQCSSESFGSIVEYRSMLLCQTTAKDSSPSVVELTLHNIDPSEAGSAPVSVPLNKLHQQECDLGNLCCQIQVVQIEHGSDLGIEDSFGNEEVPLSFQCDVCSKSFSKRDNLNKHKLVHKGDKPYLCEECGKSFIRKQDLNVHLRYHSDTRPYSCSLCKRNFHSYSGLKSHENRHNGVKPFLCNICGKNFVQKSQLTNHERIHTQEKPFSCDLCGKAFTTSTNLKTHIKRHTGINEFCCRNCNKSFFTKSGLDRHELLHTGHKPFPCSLCKLSFFTKSEITRHMRYHKGEKRFSCIQCKKSFIENQHLIIHERIHSGERPYLCQLCNKSFYTKSKLNRHMRTHGTNQP